ncbi:MULTISPECIES: SRPBCC family protein [unclassified Microbacterium]|uniref:SRPBCC family protein n=1 Tax=unclassified Microbacterium TaxID=2609290 RepID=UPI000EAAB201|nr:MULTISPECIES: SRPBCC family protein [unclassified Microbacterium]MBT2484335.1 SRPBCC domain-containing protein [Microbacterium sp. ISL-108]RKN67251.1 ATPase [Microbacterium sp. CGR2]
MPVTEVTTDAENLTMTVVADLAASVDRVWNAYSDPAQLERFWGPPGWPATFSTWDHTVGGRAVYTMNGPRGETSSGTWEFLAIEAPHRFEVIDSFAEEDGTPVDSLPSMRMTFTFEPTADGTRMVTQSHFASTEALEQVVSMGAVEGTKMAMAQLDAVLQDLREYAQGRGTQVELLDDTHVRITRLVEGPRDLVWRAHNEPDLMKQWMLGPDGWEMTECTVATEAGQSYRTSWAPVGDTEGEPFGFEGEALLVDAPRRSVTTERMQGVPTETLNDLNLYEEDGATLITILIEYPDVETRDMILATGMTDGMEASYARLESELLTV